MRTHSGLWYNYILRRESAFCPQWKLEDNKISLKPSRGIAKGCPRGS